MEKNLKKITGLWKKKNHNGKTYLTAPVDKRKFIENLESVEDVRVMVFPNKYKESEEKPDYILYITEDLNAKKKNNKNHTKYSEEYSRYPDKEEKKVEEVAEDIVEEEEEKPFPY